MDIGTASQKSRVLNGLQAVLTDQELVIRNSQTGETVYQRQVDPANERLYTGAIQIEQDRTSFYLVTDDELVLIEPGAEQEEHMLYSGESIGWPAISDINGDGQLDFILVDEAQNSLVAVNAGGGILPYFPLEAKEGQQLTGTPLVADVNDSERQEILYTTRDSLSVMLQAVDNRAKPVQDFPLLIGSLGETAEATISPIIHPPFLYAVSPAGEIKGWKFAAMDSASWPTIYGSPANLNKVAAYSEEQFSPGTEGNELLVASETYNWPNPADEQTHIRYQLTEAATLDIQIVSYSGKIVFESKFEAAAGPADEFVIQTGAWGSGPYFAVIKAKSGNRSQKKIIKIAVVH